MLELCWWSESISPGLSRQKILSASTMSVFWSRCSSPGEKPLHLPPPSIPFYGWKGPLPCLLLPALVCFQAISGENGNILWIGRHLWGRALLWRKREACVPSTPWEKGFVRTWPPSRRGISHPLYSSCKDRHGSQHVPSGRFPSFFSVPDPGGCKEEGRARMAPFSSITPLWSDPGRAGGTPGSSRSLTHTWALCFVWPLGCQDYPGLTGTRATYTWLLSLSTAAPGWSWSSRQDLPAQGHSTNQLELACPHHPIQLPREDRALLPCIIIPPACTSLA